MKNVIVSLTTLCWSRQATGKVTGELTETGGFYRRIVTYTLKIHRKENFKKTGRGVRIRVLLKVFKQQKENWEKRETRRKGGGVGLGGSRRGGGSLPSKGPGRGSGWVLSVGVGGGGHKGRRKGVGG